MRAVVLMVWWAAALVCGPVANAANAAARAGPAGGVDRATQVSAATPDAAERGGAEALARRSGQWWNSQEAADGVRVGVMIGAGVLAVGLVGAGGYLAFQNPDMLVPSVLLLASFAGTYGLAVPMVFGLIGGGVGGLVAAQRGFSEVPGASHTVPAPESGIRGHGEERCVDAAVWRERARFSITPAVGSGMFMGTLLGLAGGAGLGYLGELSWTRASQPRGVPIAGAVFGGIAGLVLGALGGYAAQNRDLNGLEVCPGAPEHQPANREVPPDATSGWE